MPADSLEGGPEWAAVVHEIKHDGIRVVARRDGPKVQIWSRYGRARTQDFPAIVAGLLALPVERFVLDGEALAHCPKGLPDFHRTLSVEGQRTACLIAYDLLEIGREDQRSLPLEKRRDRAVRPEGSADQRGGAEAWLEDESFREVSPASRGRLIPGFPDTMTATLD